jgi:Myb/SANT-like DNA-binding protein
MVLWHNAETDMLISERRRRNDYYHSIEGRSRAEFWESVARRINYRLNKTFTARQCEQKFRNLVRDYTVST